MSKDRVRAIYKHGAVVSIIVIVAAIVAYTVQGSSSFIGLLFGWAGPVGAFFFGGAYLTEVSTDRVVGEELLRGVVWYFGSLLGWAAIITLTSALSATPIAVFGLPAVTALGITFVMISTRKATGHELKIETESGQLLQLIVGAIVFGFVTLYLSLTEVFGWWVFGLYLVGIPVGVALRKALKKRYPRSFGVN